MSVLMRTKGGAPVLPGREVQVSIPARGAARLFCPARPSLPAVPGAALPPLSAPETNTLAARTKCPDHSVRRRTATRHPRAKPKSSPAPRAVRFFRVAYPHAAPGPSAPHAASRTFSATKENVRSDAHYVRRTGLRHSPLVTDSVPVPAAPFAFAGGAPTLARGISDTFHDEEKCPF